MHVCVAERLVAVARVASIARVQPGCPPSIDREGSVLNDINGVLGPAWLVTPVLPVAAAVAGGGRTGVGTFVRTAVTS